MSLDAGLTAREDLLRYRSYALESSLASIAQASQTPAAEARTLHERPAKIQQLKWRTPYVSPGAVGADPVRDIVFNFLDDQLYQMVVTYEGSRVEGLTDADLIESLSTTYGQPMITNDRLARSTSPGLNLPSEAVVIARWNTETSSLMLVRGTFSPGLQLVVTANPLYARARAATDEAARLDVGEAPQREADRRKKEAEAASEAQAKARLQNKAAFRP
jgi:hypothetical protein